MSYILEALKKAELKREQEEPSKVPTFLTGPVREPVHRVRWPYFLAAALLLNAVLGAWYLIPRKTPAASAPIQATTPIQTGPAVIVRAPAQDIRKPAPSAPGPKEVPVFVVSAEPARRPSVPEAAPMHQASLTKPSTMKPQARGAGRVLSLNELPSAIRSTLPEFRVSGHAYTPESQTRVVRINEKILQEGQDLSPGLRVEEIVPDGIVMSYGGYRFHIDVKATN